MFKKFKKGLILIVIAMVFAIGFLSVRADDDDDESEDEEEQSEDSGSSSSRSSSSQTSVKTDVKTNIKTTILKDGDGDGIIDAEDPHPAIAEIYIVEDTNRNGIVDKFESGGISQ